MPSPFPSPCLTQERRRDPFAYRLVTELVETTGRFRTLKRVLRTLEANPWIDRYKPGKNRLMVHVGLWFALKRMLVSGNSIGLAAPPPPEVQAEFLAAAAAIRADNMKRMAAQ
jgi:hypothetical protein